MKLNPKRISVIPNPFAAGLDAEGRACGLCPTDPIEDPTEPGRMVGAVVDAVMLSTVLGGEIRNARQSTGYKFLGVSNRETSKHQLATELGKREPVALKYTDYYRDRLMDGSLLPADEATAKVAGVSFLEPASVLLALSRRAETAFNAHFEGVDAYGHFIDERREAAGLDKPVAPVVVPSLSTASDSQPAV